MPTFNIDLSNADPKLLKAFANINNKIITWGDKHPGKLTPKQRETLGKMLAERAKIASKLLHANVYPINDH